MEESAGASPIRKLAPPGDNISGGEPAEPEPLSSIQRAYLIGDQDGLELRSPARYYLSCDVDASLVDGLQTHLDELVRVNAVLRTTVNADLSLGLMSERDAGRIEVDERHTTTEWFDRVNEDVLHTFAADGFDFGDWPQMRVAVVRSPRAARLHLVYALWLMDAAALTAFLAALVGGVDLTVSGSEGGVTSDASASTTVMHGAVGRRRTRDERFWRDRAAALSEPAQLPLQPQWRHAGRGVRHRSVVVEVGVVQRIAQLAREHSLTLPMVFLAAYGAVLGRLGGGGGHTLTVLQSQGERAVAARNLGNCGTAMPVPVPAVATVSFEELAREVQQSYLTQAMHASLSGAEIARLVDAVDGASRLRHPYAFTAFSTDSAGEAKLGLWRRWDDIQLRVPQVLIDHQVALDSDGSARLNFDWRVDALDPGFGDALVDMCAAFIDRLAESPQDWSRVLAAEPPTSEPRSQTPVRSTPDEMQTMHERVLEAVSLRPAAAAVVDEHGSLSYAELAERASLMRDDLESAGARPGDSVAIHLPRGRDQVVALLGSLMAGCVYVPVDRSTPDGRLASIANRGRVRFAVTDTNSATERVWLSAGVEPMNAPALRGDKRKLDWHRAVATHPIAYTIFTSGSTGEPKGVVVSHAAALTTIDAVNAELGLGPEDRVLSVSSIGFDLSVYDVFGPLMRGGAVVMLSEETAREPGAWTRLVREHGVTVWNSAPPLAMLITEEAASVPSIRAFLLSGDWIPLTLPAQLQELATGADVMSLGGATEGAIWSIYHRVTNEDRHRRSIPYGRPLPHQDVLVLNAQQEPCLPWQIGDLYIAGAGVADGYINDVERTAASFSVHPTYGWMYKTGDRGRRYPDGIVEFLGRIDTQVKLSGYRVELGEIEQQVMRLDAIRSCTVCIRSDGRRHRVVAFVALVPDTADDWRPRLGVALRHALPGYMIPEVVVELAEIPLTGNGKVDRRLLDAYPLSGPTSSLTLASTNSAGIDIRNEADFTAHEVGLCWEQVLGSLPLRGNFFDVGGSSYDAIRLLSLLRHRLGRVVSFGDFVADPTASGLVRQLRLEGSAHDKPVWTSMVRSGNRVSRRVIFFPPVGGGASCYAALSRECASEVEVHVVGMNVPTKNCPTVEDLASHCLGALPQGALDDGLPTVFAGWSFGGALAFAAAQVNSVAVEQIVVIDTPVSVGARTRNPATSDWASFTEDIRRSGGAVADDDLTAADPVLRDRFMVYRQNAELLRQWTPQLSRVPVVELRARERPAEPDVSAWGRLASKRRVLELSGGHFDVFARANMAHLISAIQGVDRG